MKVPAAPNTILLNVAMPPDAFTVSVPPAPAGFEAMVIAAVDPEMRFPLMSFTSTTTCGRSAVSQVTLNVAVCDLGGIPASVIEHAERDAAYVFRAMDVEIHWLSCAEMNVEDARMRTDFIIRVRVGGSVTTPGLASLDLMGRTFLNAEGAGYIADIYYARIQELTRQYPFASSDRVLGYTMAHELGHLLIGAGHGATGIMRGPWGRKELEALSRRHLTFSDAERAIILRKQRSRAAGSVEGTKSNERQE